MDKLTIEHLAPYLPYGLKCHNMGNFDEDGNPYVQEIVGLETDYVVVSFDNYDDRYLFEETFPILRPLSGLIREIEHKDVALIPAIYMESHDITLGERLKLISRGSKDFYMLPWWVISKLIEWHFDVFGLIEKGLAVDINTIKG